MPEQKKLGTVHIVDDDVAAAKLAATCCQSLNLAPNVWPSSSNFCAAATNAVSDGDILLLDIFMPGRDAIEVMMNLDKAGLHLPIILVSGKDPDALTLAKNLALALKHFPVLALQKPLRLETFLQAVNEIRSGASVGTA